MDTGANISVINKDFAIKHNVEFHTVPGNLILADGRKIARQQTKNLISVDYDGVDRTIHHKFEIIDNAIMS
ncbi:hypothetical protein G6F56_010271 [Rhizopus delemar]|nr:hypothetical protein G6F56_010271 [Rhizopus delemar]